MTNNSISKQFLKLANLLILISFTCVSTIKLAQAEQLLDRIVAIANDEIILLSELEEETQETLFNMRERGIQPPSLDELMPRILDNMVLDSLQNQRAKIHGLSATDEEINQQLLQMADANQLSLLELRERLNQQMPDGFNLIRGQIQQQIIIQKLHEVEILRQIDVTENEVKNYLNRQNLQAGGQTDFRLGHILITRPSSPTPAERQKLLQKAEDIRQRLRQGEDFSQMAVRHSEGAKALEGGDLGWLNAEQIPSFFVAQLNGMEVGDLSQVIESPAGFHLVKLLDKRSSGAVAVGEQAEQEAVMAIRQRKANETFDLWVRRLRDEAFVELRLLADSEQK